MKTINYFLVALAVMVTGCQTEGNKTTVASNNVPKAAVYKTINTTYTMLASKDSIKGFAKNFSAQQQAVILAVNRTDAANIVKFDSVIVPADMSGDANQYTPFPQSAPFLSDITKIVFFSYPAQYFAAYENGVLVRTGPTNMGRQSDQTPIGSYNTNWKAEDTKSTFNDEWDLKWNFNVLNKEGIGWHQYALPGYPASHSCMRMGEADAKYMYTWADQWIVKGTENVLAKGTPVIIFGAYPFGSPKPWLQLVQNPKAIDISADQLQKESANYLADIRAQQEKRNTQQAEKK